ncbi:CBS domain-containing protein [Methylocucumis oryzae]|uniref:Histidine kinase n=1 Tax=Methylocucumis oryzae TaxID=1632867 RepID=A0A0F3IIG6_9GAMM|nr:CBS domain-containing protein [Methylocucumis oryzae]KJV05259.1 histidine kinase [Methylocucumis oryzae]
MSCDTSKTIRVKEIMKSEFSRIEATQTIKEALEAMKIHRTSVLIVNKRHSDDEWGMITSSDIARDVLAKNRAPDRVNIYEVMTCPVISVHPEMDIRHCSRLFSTYNLVRAPVIVDNQVVGMISPNSLVLDGLYAICN